MQKINNFFLIKDEALVRGISKEFTSLGRRQI